MEDEEEMWLNEDEDDEDEAAEEKGRSDEDFPESYEKFMEAKKGTCPFHLPMVARSWISELLVRLGNSSFLTPASYLSLQLKKVRTKKTFQSGLQLAALSLPCLILQALRTEPTAPTAKPPPRPPPPVPMVLQPRQLLSQPLLSSR